MILKDVIEHFYNGSDKIISARYEGEEERYLFFNGVQFTKEEEAFYRKVNYPLPIIDTYELIRKNLAPCPSCGAR
mgnify:CR=1 FL=1